MISLDSSDINYTRTVTLITLQTNRRRIPTLDFPDQLRMAAEGLDI